MQTFLPFRSFHESAQALDSKRLNKQILEGYQILNVLSSNNPKAGWRNHPAVKMWRWHEGALLEYIYAMINEADSRGIKTENNLANIKSLHNRVGHKWGKSMPPWFNNQDFMNRIMTTHKANLYKKDPDYYHEFASSVYDPNNKPCCDRCNYFWVTHVE